jgi:hypothetical protein
VASLADPSEWSEYARGDAPVNAQTLLDVASGVVRTYCGWSISEEDVVDGVYDADGSRLLLLPTLYLTAVHEVLIDGVAVTDFSWSQMGALSRDGRWPAGFRRVMATWGHGYTDTPAEIKAIVFGLAQRGTTVRPGLRTRTVGAVTYQYADGASGSALDEAEKSVLDRYRLPPS